MYWAEETFLQRAWAAWLWAGPLSVLSHGTAATLAGLQGLAPEETIHLTLPVKFGLWSRPSVTVHRTRSTFAPEELEHFEGLPFTSGARTLVDVSRSVSEDDYRSLVAGAFRCGAASPRAVQKLCEHVPNRPGARILRASLARLSLKDG